MASASQATAAATADKFPKPTITENTISDCINWINNGDIVVLHAEFKSALIYHNCSKSDPFAKPNLKLTGASSPSSSSPDAVSSSSLPSTTDASISSDPSSAGSISSSNSSCSVHNSLSSSSSALEKTDTSSEEDTDLSSSFVHLSTDGSESSSPSVPSSTNSSSSVSKSVTSSSSSTDKPVAKSMDDVRVIFLDCKDIPDLLDPTEWPSVIKLNNCFECSCDLRARVVDFRTVPHAYFYGVPSPFQ